MFNIIRKNIPNYITCLNILSGCAAIVFAFENKLPVAAYLIVASAIIDFFDGFTARLLNAKSEMGKELDSLADVVSFGVAPAAIMFRLMMNNNFSVEFELLPYLSFFIAVFSAWRLAKFNLDEKQADSFIGMPTPACALFIASLSFLNQNTVFSWLFTNTSLLIITTILCVLLVSSLPLFSLKFKNIRWKGNEFRYSLIILSFILLIIFQFPAVTLIVILYLVLSIIQNLVCTKKAQ